MVIVMFFSKTLIAACGLAMALPLTALADPKPSGAGRADPNVVANAYAGNTVNWKSCKAGVYYGGAWEATALCEKEGASLGLGKWSVTQKASVCLDLVWYWREGNETKSQPQEKNPDCINHVVDANGQIWHNWDGDNDWWRGVAGNMDKGFKYKRKVKRLRRKLDV